MDGRDMKSVEDSKCGMFYYFRIYLSSLTLVLTPFLIDPTLVTINFPLKLPKGLAIPLNFPTQKLCETSSAVDETEDSHPHQCNRHH